MDDPEFRDPDVQLAQWRAERYLRRNGERMGYRSLKTFTRGIVCRTCGGTTSWRVERGTVLSEDAFCSNCGTPTFRLETREEGRRRSYNRVNAWTWGDFQTTRARREQLDLEAVVPIASGTP